jgi:colanic acid biosynthesis glycosyl transferase WcaI
MLNSLTFSMMAAFFGLFRVRRRDIVFTTNGSLFAGLAGFFLATFKGGKFIYNVQDLYPEVPIIQGHLRKRRSIWLFSRVQRTMYGLADHISVITPSFKSNLMAKGVDEDKISTIPNFVDVGFIRPTAKSNGFSRTHLLEDKFVVSHSGSMGYVYDLDMLIEAAQRLRDDDDVMFVFVGDGVHKRRLQKRADALQLVNVCFLPFQPYRDLPRIRGASDVQVALYRTAAATYSMPHKVYEIMASGRPILASAEQGSDLEQLVNDCECGFCVNPGDTDGLVAAITKLKENPALAEDMGRTGRQRAETTYSKSIVVDAYEELFRGQTGDG